MSQVITYYSSNAKVPWIAYALLSDGSLWQVRCEGQTEEEASARAIALLAAQRDKWVRLGETPARVVAADETPIQEAPSASDWVTTLEGRGAQFVSKVWLLNRATGDRQRVLPNEVDKFTALGYVRAGPRSN